VVSRTRVAALAVACVFWLLPAGAHACAVCYGPAESPALQGTRLSILFLLVLTYVLLGGGVASFLLLRRRAVRRQGTVHTSEGLP
jgi:hypothetical protein